MYFAKERTNQHWHCMSGFESFQKTNNYYLALPKRQHSANTNTTLLSVFKYMPNQLTEAYIAFKLKPIITCCTAHS